MSGDVLVEGGRVLRGFGNGDAADWVRDGAVLVRDGVVADVAPADRLRSEHPRASRAGGPQFTVIPGFVNSHHHVGLTPFQLGSADHHLEHWFASRLALRDVDLRLDTLYSAMEMVRSGVTTVQHLHSRAPGNVEDVLGAAHDVVGAYEELGMRASYSLALRDQNRIVYGDDDEFVATAPARLQPRLRAFLDRFTLPLEDQVVVFEELLARHSGAGRLAVQLAPANLHWLSDRALDTARDLADRAGVPLHMHVAETPYQREYARRRGGGTAVHYLDRYGLITSALTIGHGTWLSDDDIDLCADRGVRVCHNCSSNLRLASGRAPVTRMLAAGIEVALGIDEAGINDDRDMLQEMRLALVSNREPGHDGARLDAGTVLRMATEYGAATTPFAGSIGRLAPGAAADLVLLNWDAVTFPYQSARSPIEDVLVQRGRPNAVDSVMVAGEWVLQAGRFRTVDEAAVLGEIASTLAAGETRAESDRPAFADEVLREVRRFYDGYLPGNALRDRA